MSFKRLNQGFTLIELVVVIIILAILAIVAAPKFITFSTEARVSGLAQLNASAKTANNLVYARSQMSSFSTQAVGNRDDLLDIDLEGDGSFNTRLKWGYLDNTDIEDWLILDDGFTIEYRGIADTFIGYDLSGDGKVLDDNCYFHYVQASNANTPPEYNNVTTGC
ncbi:prepilin-type N-terminal cleavage/methylation domain-containing protein [uncultured Shewanella sp.]|uniref:prepilin-type N-terminal cleavage/methylation domain-containing protein n=1 Tax=uncultured Shewanella sp. TaxID=173975 RepID=UPI0026155EC0|nr:prepilin-type N-terminal cleavage/methylation domain-containing protein [uncultured Shewanella sp.]